MGVRLLTVCMIVLLLASGIPGRNAALNSSAEEFGKQCEITVWEGEKVVPDLVATDPDLNQGVGPAGRLILTYGPPFNAQGEWQTNIGDKGVHKSFATVNDGEFQDRISFCVEVLRRNRPPQAQPIAITIEQGTTIRLRPKVSDPDRQKLFVAYGAPISKQGIFAAKTPGIVRTKYRVSDGQFTAEAPITITVQAKKRIITVRKPVPKKVVPQKRIAIIHQEKPKEECTAFTEECGYDTHIAFEVETLDEENPDVEVRDLEDPEDIHLAFEIETLNGNNPLVEIRPQVLPVGDRHLVFEVETGEEHKNVEVRQIARSVPRDVHTAFEVETLDETHGRVEVQQVLASPERDTHVVFELENLERSTPSLQDHVTTVRRSAVPHTQRIEVDHQDTSRAIVVEHSA